MMQLGCDGGLCYLRVIHVIFCVNPLVHVQFSWARGSSRYDHPPTIMDEKQEITISCVETQSGDAPKRARAIVQAVTHFNNPKVLAEVCVVSFFVHR
jgi:hypothetical protein